MSDAVRISIIGGCFSLASLVVGGFIAYFLKKVISKVDGTQTKMLAANTELSVEVKMLTGALANLSGRIQGRDETREHIEARADAQAAKDVK